MNEGRSEESWHNVRIDWVRIGDTLMTVPSLMMNIVVYEQPCAVESRVPATASPMCAKPQWVRLTRR